MRPSPRTHASKPSTTGPAFPHSASLHFPSFPCNQAAGLKFFPGYLSDGRREAIDETALVVQRQGYAQLRRIKPGSTPPLLPAPEGSVPAAAPPPTLVAADGSLALPPTDQRRALGAVHVCEHTECERGLLLGPARQADMAAVMRPLQMLPAVTFLCSLLALTLWPRPSFRQAAGGALLGEQRRQRRRQGRARAAADAVLALTQPAFS